MKQNDIMVWIFLVVGILFVSIYFYNTFLNNNKTSTITFNITGITNSSNSTLANLHFECIKFCTSRDHSNMCYNQCSLLGKEGCEVK